MSRNLSQNDLFDIHDRLADGPDDAARWLAAQDLFAGVGAEWVTAGTAPVTALHAVAVATTTPETLMRDYISERIYETDPWMAHSNASSRIDEVEIDNNRFSLLVDAKAPIVGLLSDHGVRHVCLIPAWTGTRPGAFVLYSNTSDGAGSLRRPCNVKSTRRLAHSVAAWFRPERLDPDHGDIYVFRPVLSRREHEALKWLSLGLRTTEIAWKMRIENVTVSKHFASARRKLSARTREHALAIAIRDGLIQL